MKVKTMAKAMAKAKAKTKTETKVKTKTEKNNPTFEQSLGELETLVDKLERGQLTLDESLDTFETGMKLARVCTQKLTKAERKIEKLIENNGKLQTEPFENDK